MFSKVFEETANRVRKTIANTDIASIPYVLGKLANDEKLNLSELSVLLKARNSNYREDILECAERLTRKIFDSKVGFIAPIYIDTNCKNKCRYCGMASYNKGIEREWIDLETFKEELEVVAEMKYNTVELVAGSIEYDLDLIANMMTDVKNKVDGPAFCFDSLDEEQYASFVDVNYTMIHFQETYYKTLYGFYHPANSKKGNFEYRLDAPERAILNGLKKVGIGILFGLSHMEYDVLMTIEYGRYLEKEYGISPHAIGIPRLKNAKGSELQHIPFPVHDRDHLFATVAYRLAFPFSEMVASTRECPLYIKDLLKYSATFTNFCCTLKPGGYRELKGDGLDTEGQFYYFSPGFKSISNIVDELGLEMDFRRFI
jgi:2-iminoacetate synthase